MLRMNHATLVYPHQLFLESPALDKKHIIFLIEEPLMLREFPIHAQKLIFHRLSMVHYKNQLEDNGYKVRYLKIGSIKETEDVFKLLAQENISHLHILDTTDFWLEKRIEIYAKKYSFETIRYESPLFLLSKEDATTRYFESKKHMARFYKKMRIDNKILMDGNEPIGGKWSFDEDNRKKLPKAHIPPSDMALLEKNKQIEEAIDWVQQLEGFEIYGKAEPWLPYTHHASEVWLEAFIRERFTHFGTYEDALSVEHTLLYHSGISALLNVGLLTPNQVLTAVLQHSENIPINSLEGFVRQIIGWREFMRASYEVDGVNMRTKNFFQHSRQLPDYFWSGETGIDPVDVAIKKTLRYGYVHHIDRLMVLGNVMLLSEINPKDVYRWFMAMYVDAYDWVMVPNVYGMSQFSDGGSFATKPYIAGSNYIKKMSNFKKGQWEQIMTGLYWNFIHRNKEVFIKNHRMSMMPRLWDKMSAEKQSEHLAHAKTFIEKE